MPFFSFFVARLTGAPFLYRYSISTVAGFGCVLGIVTAKRPPVGLGVLLFLVAQIGLNQVGYAQGATVREPSSSLELSTRADEFERKYRAMEAVPDKNSLIVLLDDLAFLPIMHYAPPNMASRLVYVVYPHDLTGEGYIRLQRYCRAPGRVERLPEFLSTQRAFIIYCDSRSFSRLNYFSREGADLRLESVSEDSFLVSVTFKQSRGESAATPLH
jgi:hypothetical protein